MRTYRLLTLCRELNTALRAETAAAARNHHDWLLAARCLTFSHESREGVMVGPAHLRRTSDWPTPPRPASWIPDVIYVEQDLDTMPDRTAPRTGDRELQRFLHAAEETGYPIRRQRLWVIVGDDSPETREAYGWLSEYRAQLAFRPFGRRSPNHHTLVDVVRDVVEIETSHAALRSNDGYSVGDILINCDGPSYDRLDPRPPQAPSPKCHVVVFKGRKPSSPQSARLAKLNRVWIEVRQHLTESAMRELAQLASQVATPVVVIFGSKDHGVQVESPLLGEQFDDGGSLRTLVERWVKRASTLDMTVGGRDLARVHHELLAWLRVRARRQSRSQASSPKFALLHGGRPDNLHGCVKQLESAQELIEWRRKHRSCQANIAIPFWSSATELARTLRATNANGRTPAISATVLAFPGTRDRKKRAHVEQALTDWGCTVKYGDTTEGKPQAATEWLNSGAAQARANRECSPQPRSRGPRSRGAVAILGPTGSGKTDLGRFLHFASDHRHIGEGDLDLWSFGSQLVPTASNRSRPTASNRSRQRSPGVVQLREAASASDLSETGIALWAWRDAVHHSPRRRAAPPSTWAGFCQPWLEPDRPATVVNLSGVDDHQQFVTRIAGRMATYSSENPIPVYGQLLAAANGTLILNEIGDATDASQGWLLELLERGGPVVPTFGSEAEAMYAHNTMFAIMTNREHAIRRELVGRCQVFRLPPLAAVSDDVPDATLYHILKARPQRPTGLARCAAAALRRWRYWPGNHRDAAHLAERLSAARRGDVDYACIRQEHVYAALHQMSLLKLWPEWEEEFGHELAASSPRLWRLNGGSRTVAIRRLRESIRARLDIAAPLLQSLKRLAERSLEQQLEMSHELREREACKRLRQTAQSLWGAGQLLMALTEGVDAVNGIGHAARQEMASTDGALFERVVRCAAPPLEVLSREDGSTLATILAGYEAGASPQYTLFGKAQWETARPQAR